MNACDNRGRLVDETLQQGYWKVLLHWSGEIVVHADDGAAVEDDADDDDADIIIVTATVCATAISQPLKVLMK